MRTTLHRFERIRKSREIGILLKEGKKWGCKLFTLYFKKNSFKYSRFGVLVSRRCGKAVTRNKIKRTTREFLRKNKNSNPPYFDILIKFRPGYEKEILSESEIHYKKWLEIKKITSSGQCGA